MKSAIGEIVCVRCGAEFDGGSLSEKEGESEISCAKCKARIRVNVLWREDELASITQTLLPKPPKKDLAPAAARIEAKRKNNGDEKEKGRIRSRSRRREG